MVLGIVNHPRNKILELFQTFLCTDKLLNGEGFGDTIHTFDPNSKNIVISKSRIYTLTQRHLPDCFCLSSRSDYYSLGPMLLTRGLWGLVGLHLIIAIHPYNCWSVVNFVSHIPSVILETDSSCWTIATTKRRCPKLYILSCVLKTVSNYKSRVSI